MRKQMIQSLLVRDFGRDVTLNILNAFGNCFEDTFLSINDLINNVLDRYERYQRGDYTAPPPPEPAYVTCILHLPARMVTLTPHSRCRVQKSLIDFDFDQAIGGSSGADPASNVHTSAVDDLSSLFGGGPSAAAPSAPPTFASLIQPAAVPTTSLSNNTSTSTTSNGWGANVFAPSQPASPFGGGNGYGGIALGSGTLSPMRPGSSAANYTSPPAVAPGAANTGQQANKDPFADLAGLF